MLLGLPAFLRSPILWSVESEMDLLGANCSYMYSYINNMEGSSETNLQDNISRKTSVKLVHFVTHLVQLVWLWIWVSCFWIY